MITLKDVESLGYDFSEAKDCYYGSTIQIKEVPESIKKKLSEALEWSKDGKDSISVDDYDDWRIFFREDVEHSLIFHYRWGSSTSTRGGILSCDASFTTGTITFTS